MRQVMEYTARTLLWDYKAARDGGDGYDAKDASAYLYVIITCVCTHASMHKQT
jgi:hypothetical protein